MIDLDWLGWSTLPDPTSVIARNLASVWTNYRAAGVRYIVMARTIRNEGELGLLRSALPDVELAVVRLDSPPELVEERLRARDSGSILEEHLHQTSEFAAEVAGVRADLVVVNGQGPIEDAAGEVLSRLGWI